MNFNKALQSKIGRALDKHIMVGQEHKSTEIFFNLVRIKYNITKHYSAALASKQLALEKNEGFLTFCRRTAKVLLTVSTSWREHCSSQVNPAVYTLYVRT